MIFELIDIAKLFSCFVLLLLLIYLIHKAQPKPSRLFIVMFFFSQFYVIAFYLVQKNYDVMVEYLPFLGYSILPFCFMWGPSMYLYIVSDHYSNYKLNWTNILHFIPSLVILVILTVMFYTKPVGIKRELLTTNLLIEDIDWKIISYLVIVQVFVYNTLATFKIKKISKSWNFGNLNKNRLKWNKFILFGYFITCIIYDILSIINEFYSAAEAYFLVSDILFFTYFFIIIYKAITSQNLFSISEISSKSVLNKKIDEVNNLQIRLDSFMKSEKPFLDYNLTLLDLAQSLQVSERVLSTFIKSYKNQNFYDYINTYRINEAISILNERLSSEKTIQEIMYYCGFNSKSSFNTSFKKITGCTPTQYRNKRNPTFSYN